MYGGEDGDAEGEVYTGYCGTGGDGAGDDADRGDNRTSDGSPGGAEMAVPYMKGVGYVGEKTNHIYGRFMGWGC